MRRTTTTTAAREPCPGVAAAGAGARRRAPGPPGRAPRRAVRGLRHRLAGGAGVGAHGSSRRPRRHCASGQQQHDGVDDDAERRRVALPQLVEPLVVGVLHEEGRRVAGPAAGQDVHGVEGLEAEDHRVDDEEEGRRREQRPGDRREGAPASRPVHGRGLVDLPRDSLQAGQVDHHAEPDALPGGHHDDRHQGGGARRTASRPAAARTCWRAG